jgi:23S rRNA (guanosine2251-2'-O)-methyltransferase
MKRHKSGDRSATRGFQKRPDGRPQSNPSRMPSEALRPRSDDGTVAIYGMHAVKAALVNPRRRIKSLIVTENAEARLADTLPGRKVQTERVSPRDLERMLGSEAVHQGVLAHCEPLPETTLEDISARVAPHHPLVVLDQVTDPHNVGAILRSAAVFGAAGLVMTRRHSPPLSGALAKTASGALELVPIALVGNLARALEEMGELDIHRVGLDGEAETNLESAPFESRLALVLGSEGKGLRRLTREHCDRLSRIGARGALASLNVSNAAAVALYAAGRGARERD